MLWRGVNIMAEPRRKSIGNMNGTWAYLFKFSLVLMVGVVVPWCVWLSLMLFSFGDRLTTIEANRWTAADQASYQAAEVGAFKDIWIAINKLPTEVPPVWFLDRFNRLEAKVDTLEEKIDTLRTVK